LNSPRKNGKDPVIKKLLSQADTYVKSNIQQINWTGKATIFWNNFYLLFCTRYWIVLFQKNILKTLEKLWLTTTSVLLINQATAPMCINPTSLHKLKIFFSK